MSILSSTLPGHETPALASPAPARRGWLVPCALLAVLLAGAALRAHDLGGECFDEDELYAVHFRGASLQNLGSVIGRDGFHTNHPPLMTVPYLYWNAVFGTDEAHVRALPMLAGAAAIVLLYLLGRRLAGPGVGLLAALLLAVNPLHIAYSREARQYALLVALTLTAHVLFLRCLQKGTWRTRLAYAVVVTLDLFTHYFAVPALAAHGIIALWLTFRGTPAVRRSAGATLLTLGLGILPFVAWLPAMPWQAAHNSPYHLAPGITGDLLRCLQDVQGLGTGLTPVAIVAGAIAVLLIGLGLASRRRDDVPVGSADLRPPLPRWAAVILVVVGLTGALTLYLASPTYILPSAEATLRTYRYEQGIISEELALLRLELAAFPLALAACGALLLGWSRCLGLLERLPVVGWPSQHPLSVAGFVAALLLVPLVTVRLVALLGVPFVTPRNMLILAPVGSLALALGLAALLRSRPGRALAALSLLALAIAAAQYEPIASLWGGEGQPLGMHTAPWRDVAADLAGLPGDVPLLASMNPATGPAMYYLTAYHPRRVELGGEPQEPRLPELPAHFRLIHLERNFYCKQLRDALTEQRATLTPLSRHGTAVLYDVRLGGAGNAS